MDLGYQPLDLGRNCRKDPTNLKIIGIGSELYSNVSKTGPFTTSGALVLVTQKFNEEL